MEGDPIKAVLGNPLLLRNSLRFLDYDSILNYCRTYTQAKAVCQDRVFWEQKAKDELGTPISTFRKSELPPDQRYFQLFNFDEFARRAIRANRMDLLQDAIESEAIPSYSSWHNLADQAILANKQQMFDYILSAAPPELFSWSWDHFAGLAAKNGYQQLLDHILRFPRQGTWDIDFIAGNAVRYGHRQLFDHILSLVPPDFQWDWKHLALQAQYGGQRAMFNYIQKLASTRAQ